MNLAEISVTVLTRNSQRTLKETLHALEPFGEVIVYDMDSTDNTLDIAKKFPNTKIVHGVFIGYGPTHNMASAVAKNDWILVINSDEVVSTELVKTLTNAPLDSSAVYSFPRHNFFNGKWIKSCGWYPDRKIKLYNRRQTRFTDDKIHESIMTTGMRIVAFHPPIRRYAYSSTTDLLAKMQSYSSLFAEHNCGKKYSSIPRALTRGIAAFMKSYVVKRGFLDGSDGFVISAHNASTTYYKYVKLYEANKDLQGKLR